MTLLIPLLVALSITSALIPALLMWSNLRRFLPPPPPATGRRPSISVLIPARDEGTVIEASVQAAAASRDVEVEVIVLDDRSEDTTAAIVQEMARRDPKVRLVHGKDLPPGWCGKQHACWLLAHEARHPYLVFIDADVRLAPDALARLVAGMEESGVDLLSGFPGQETVGLIEKLVIPLMHFILLGFLPIARMRRSHRPEFAAGCGQLFVTRREAYDRAGGHAAIRRTLHDGIRLPRAYRQAGLRTDLCDATDLAVCRMYRSAAAVWNGLAKNAGEALAAPRMIGPMSVILLGGQVFPVGLVVAAILGFPAPWRPFEAGCAVAALGLSYYARWAPTIRCRQSWFGAVFHPLGVLIFVAIQWYAFARDRAGRPSTWKGRHYGAPVAVSTSSWESSTQ